MEKKFRTGKINLHSCTNFAKCYTKNFEKFSFKALRVSVVQLCKTIFFFLLIFAKCLFVWCNCADSASKVLGRYTLVCIKVPFISLFFLAWYGFRLGRTRVAVQKRAFCVPIGILAPLNQ